MHFQVNWCILFNMRASVVPSRRASPNTARKSPSIASARGRVHHRTTIALSAAAIATVERFQKATGLSMSEAVNELIERADPRPPRIKYVDGFPTADVPLTGKRITTEDVLRAEAEPW